jgi:hypothetical protein
MQYLATLTFGLTLVLVIAAGLSGCGTTTSKPSS